MAAVGLEIFLGIGALFGGGQFIVAPDGHLPGMTPKVLAGTPFPSYLVPGIILFMFVGVGPLLAAAITVRRLAVAPLAAVAVGLTLVGWISVEMVFLGGIGSLAWAFTFHSAVPSRQSESAGGARRHRRETVLTRASSGWTHGAAAGCGRFAPQAGIRRTQKAALLLHANPSTSTC